MKPGPKPKPTVIKKLQGNPGKRKLPDNEPQPEKPDRPPAAPRYLCKAGKKKWRQKAKELHASGVLTKLDCDRLESYCVEYATWRKAVAEVQEKGELIKTKNEAIIVNPWLPIRNKADDKMGKIAAAFGMDPSSRSRVTVEKKKEADPLEEFLNSGEQLKVVK